MISSIRIAGLLIAAVAALAGCDQQRIQELEEDVSTEADVQARFGVPEQVWVEAGGARTLEYNRQPAGHQNYMITIGADGRMTALRQVLTPHVFAQIQAGMNQDAVRRMLGKPAKQMTFALKQETDWDWQWIDPPTREMIFTVTFGSDGRVLRAASMEKLPEGR